MRLFVILVITSMISIWPFQIIAGEEKRSGSKEIFQKQIAVEQRGTFSPAERNLIRAQLLGKQNTLLQQEQRQLPSDWQKKIAAGKSLSYHIYRQAERLPAALLQRLPQPPEGSVILIIAGKIIRINETTRTILDVFDLVPRH